MDITINQSVSGAGLNISSVVTRSVDNADALTPNDPAGFPAGKTVTAWVKTDADTAACNLPGGHGYTTGTFDVYWTENGVLKRRYSVTGTVSTNALALDGGSGDAFPASATVGVVVTRQISFNVSILGDNLKVLMANMKLPSSNVAGRGHIAFYDSSPALVGAIDLPFPAADIVGGSANALAGLTIASAKASNASATVDAILQLLLGQDSTP